MWGIAISHLLQQAFGKARMAFEKLTAFRKNAIVSMKIPVLPPCCALGSEITCILAKTPVLSKKCACCSQNEKNSQKAPIFTVKSGRGSDAKTVYNIFETLA